MATHFFSGAKTELLPEIEKFRELQAFCSHDLRSQLGAVTGLMRLLEDQLSSVDDKTKTSFRLALTSAQDALENLDADLAEARPAFDTVWLIGFSEAEVTAMNFESLFEARPLRRSKPVLFLHFEAAVRWQSRLKKYRPLAAFFKTRAALSAGGPGEAVSWIHRLGPQLTRIYLFDAEDGPVAGVRADAVDLLSPAADVPGVAQQILQALESLPSGRS